MILIIINSRIVYICRSASSPEKSMTAEVALDPNVVKLRDRYVYNLH